MTKISQKESPLKDDSSNSSCNESNGMPPAKSLTTNKVKKSTNNHNKMDVTTDEMQLLLAKLKELVPNIPRNKKLSKLEIIQYVIDYIFDLQLALDTHPPTCQSSNNSSPSSSALQTLRQPLAEMWSS